jgi:protein TonB
MSRTTAAIALSVASHILMLSLLPGPTAQAPSGSMRVALSGVSAAASGPPGNTPSPSALPEPAADSLPQEIKAETPKKPKKTEKTTKPVKPPEKPVTKKKTPQAKPAAENTRENRAVSSAPVASTSSAAATSPAATSSRQGGGSAPASTAGTPGSSAARGGVVDISRLTVSRKVAPDYPAIARKRREEGTVTLLMTLNGESVSTVEVEKTSGYAVLDKAAVAAARQWRFQNAGTLQVRVPITFRLNR